MRYRFADEVTRLDPARIEVSKTFAVGDDAFSGPSGPATVPSSLILELLAMTGGRLLFERLERRRLPLLLKVEECRFEATAGPGVRLEARAELCGLSADEPPLAELTAEVRAGGRLVAAGRLLYIGVAVPRVDLATQAGAA